MPGVAETPERRAGDRFLLAAPGDGWVDREELLRTMMPFVMPGKAYRIRARMRLAAAKSRGRLDEDGQYKQTASSHDPLEVGRRHQVSGIFFGAVRSGMWVRDGDRVRHRDHPAARDGV